MHTKRTVINIPTKLGNKRIEVITNILIETIEHYLREWSKTATVISEAAFVSYVREQSAGLQGVYIYTAKQWKKLGLKNLQHG
jgi:hypothetical protein